MAAAFAIFQFAISREVHSSEFLTDTRSQLFEKLKMDEAKEFGYNSGLLIGHFLIPFILTILVLVFLHNRKYYSGILILIGLISVQSVSIGIPPIISIVVFSLMLTKPAGKYFGKDFNAYDNILDDGTIK